MSIYKVDPKVIESIPLAVLKITPAETPPLGIRPDFVNPTTRVPVILGISIAFLVLAIFYFSIRIFTKLVIVKKWKWDDLTCSLGFMFSIVHLVTVVLGCILGSTGKHGWDIFLDRALNKSSLNQGYITTITITPALGFIKCSFFIQYYLLFRPFKWVRFCVWIGATISIVFYVAVSITAFVLNSPWPGESLLEGLLSWHYFKFAQFSIPTGVIGMLVDWYLFILPIRAVWILQMSTSKKLGVLIIFMTGGLATIASTVNLSYRIKLQNDPSDPTWKVGYILLWTHIEMFAGVAASSMPTVHQFFTRQNFSLASRWLSLKSSLIGSKSGVVQMKASNHDFNIKNWGNNKLHSSQNRKGIKKRDLESDGCERNTVEASSMGNSQIHLTHDISITEESLVNASFAPEARITDHPR